MSTSGGGSDGRCMPMKTSAVATTAKTTTTTMGAREMGCCTVRNVAELTGVGRAGTGRRVA
jgi:hypothetical protein